MVGFATMFSLQKQEQKARNMLKRVVKMPYDHDHADYHERALLLLATSYIEKKKFDLAQDLCRRCLQFNKANFRAFETLGQIHEHELAYKDAAEVYEQAWGFVNSASPSIGYKLAFNCAYSSQRQTDRPRAAVVSLFLLEILMSV